VPIGQGGANSQTQLRESQTVEPLDTIKKPISTKKRNLDVLTSWRFFAAAMVVFFHFGAKPFAAGPEVLLRIIKNGYQAVSFFFILSGFVLVYTYYDPASHTGMNTTPRRFWLARFARIYPVYALALVLALPVFLWTALSKKSMSPLEIGLTLSLAPALLQAWVPPICLAWNIPAWSLSVEAFFYLLFPWLASTMLRWKTHSLLITSAVIAISVHALQHCVFPLAETGAPGPVATSSHHFFAYSPIFHLATFVFGMALGRAYLRISTQDRNSAFFNTLMIASLASICILLSLHGLIRPVFLSDTVMVPIYGCLIFSSAHCSGMLEAVLGNRCLVALGNASYGIYIIHHPVGWWLSICLRPLYNRHAIWWFALYFAVVVGASLFIHKYFEMPLKNKCLTRFAPKK
jgi:peptidoglycan/LPS O-acetylase OafA/YrhL